MINPFYAVPTQTLARNLSKFKSQNKQSIRKQAEFELAAVAMADPIVTDLSDVEVHLIKCFFYSVHRSAPMFDERDFYSKISPVNRQPPYLMNSIYAVGMFFFGLTCIVVVCILKPLG